MTWQRLLSGLTLALLFSTTASGQDSAKTRTFMLLGAGLPGQGATTRLTPAYTVGFGLQPARSRISYRLMTEFWESEVAGTTHWRQARTAGIQLLGVRTFGARVVQPYFLAGGGLYLSTSRGTGHRVSSLSDSGLVLMPFLYDTRETLPAFIWGTGVNIRIRRMTFYGELKLPLYNGIAFNFGPHSPLLFGIRF